MNIPITKPYVDIKEEQAVSAVIRSGWLTQGPKVTEFENMVAEYTGARYAVACTSCTTALHLALEVSEIKPGDEVIVPSYTFIATPNSVLHIGAKPIFADIDIETYNIDPKDIEKKITKKTKAIIPVHQVGLPADMEKIIEIAKRHNLIVIEDAACAIGSEYKGQRIGGISDLSCFSFHPRKLITTGEGGMVTTNNKDYDKQLRLLISHGASISDFSRHSSKKIIFEEYSLIGYNFRMTNMQGALGVLQMGKLDEILKKRRYLAERYNEAFNQIDCIIPPFIPDYAKPNYQSYMISLTDDCRRSRNEIMQKMQERGIATRRGIMACHLEPCYQKLYGKISLPKTEKALETTIILPLYPQMTEEEQDYVIKNLIKLIT